MANGLFVRRFPDDRPHGGPGNDDQNQGTELDLEAPDKDMLYRQENFQ